MPQIANIENVVEDERTPDIYRKARNILDAPSPVDQLASAISQHVGNVGLLDYLAEQPSMDEPRRRERDVENRRLIDENGKGLIKAAEILAQIVAESRYSAQLGELLRERLRREIDTYDANSDVNDQSGGRGIKSIAG